MCFRAKEHIRYLKQKMASGKGFHVVSCYLINTNMHHSRNSVLPRLFQPLTVLSHLHSWFVQQSVIVVKVSVSYYCLFVCFFSRVHSRRKWYYKGTSIFTNNITSRSLKCKQLLKIFYAPNIGPQSVLIKP